MSISNYVLFPEQNGNMSGLFKQIVQIPQNTVFVNNLTLRPAEIRSGSASMVGALAGLIDSAFIYNVNIDNPDITILGQNAVGGLAGIIRGNFRVDGITSNVSVNASYRQTVGSKLNIYTGKINTNLVDVSNINVVSYAGSIAGIVEGYTNVIDNSALINYYAKIKNCYTTGNVLVVAEVAGGMFGLITERSYCENLTFDAGDNAVIKGVYYSGGIAGENRGVISNALTNASEDKLNLFFSETETKFSLVSGGIVAVNYGGLIHNSVNNVNVVSIYHLATVGGIAGRNSNGTIAGCKNLAGVFGLYAGGIVGTDYSYETMIIGSNASGSITEASKYALPKTKTNYTMIGLTVFDEQTASYVSLSTASYQGIAISNLDAWYLSQTAFMEKLELDMSAFYSVLKIGDIVDTKIKTSRVLGAIVGLTDKNITSELNTNLEIKHISNLFVNEIVNNNKLYSNFVKFEHPTEGAKEYTELQNYLYNATNVNHYYFVAVVNASYDFWNMNSGYSVGYARVY